MRQTSLLFPAALVWGRFLFCAEEDIAAPLLAFLKTTVRDTPTRPETGI